jgi:hypothetical protein
MCTGYFGEEVILDCGIFGGKGCRKSTEGLETWQVRKKSAKKDRRYSNRNIGLRVYK